MEKMTKEEYRAADAVRELNVIDIRDLEKETSGLIPKGGFGYIQGGAGDEWTMYRNTEAFCHKLIVPRVLADLEKPELNTSILGTDISLPVIMAPVAAQGLAHVSGEAGTAKGVAASGSIMCISTYSSQTIEQISIGGGGGPQWFQLYLSKDDGFNKSLLDEAKECGAKAIVLTADATVGGNREVDLHNRFTFPLSMPIIDKNGQGKGQSIADIYAKSLQKITVGHIEKIASISGLPVIVKGIQSPEDAMLAIGGGASAVYVSNHGGRQLDGAPASFDVLESIAKAVDKRVPIIFDSGVRRGQHVFKALACGADVVAIGRPAIYGLACGGWMGVKSVFDFFRKELAMVMQLSGTKTVDKIKNIHL